MQQWTKLACECGSDKFIQLHELIFHPSGGTTDKLGGRKCSKCGKEVDQGKLIKQAKRKQAETELKELEQEVKNMP